MTEFHLNYPSSADYPTAMYYAVEYSTALLATDSDDGASVFHFTPSNAIEKSRISSSLTGELSALCLYFSVSDCM